jgi:uncharacterized protein
MTQAPPQRIAIRVDGSRHVSGLLQMQTDARCCYADPAAVAQATVRAAVDEAAKRAPGLALIAGGKSFGGRMTSQAQAASELAGVRGLAFLGFPLHPAGRPSIERGEHLSQVEIPMLFLQGTEDALADSRLMNELAQQLGSRARLEWLTGADHSFHVPAKSGLRDADIRSEVLDLFFDWTENL